MTAVGLVGYLLLRVNRVNVRVDADSRRELSTKPKTDPGNSESALTSEAINIAREAAGNDNARSGNAAPSPSPNPSATPTPSAGPYFRANYSYTGNPSPVFDQMNDANRDGNQQQNGAGNPQEARTGGVPTTAPMQNHANSTASIFVDEAPAKSPTASQMIGAAQIEPRLKNRPAAINAAKTQAVLPPFGAMLPVRTQGVIFTLRNNSYARLELTRDFSGQGWSLPKGTVFIGRTTGSDADRAFVNVIGYIDPRENKLVKIFRRRFARKDSSPPVGLAMRMSRGYRRSSHTLRACESARVRGRRPPCLSTSSSSRDRDR